MERNERLFIEKNLPTVVIITRTKWDEMPRIRHQVTRQLVRFFNVIYIEKHVGMKGYEHRDQMKKISNRLIIYSPSLPIPLPSRLFRIDPVTHRIANTYIKKKIIKFIDQFDCKNRILFNFEFDFPEITRSPSFCYKIYLCNDEFPNMNLDNKNKMKAWFQRNLLQYYENQVIKNTDKCLAVSYPLKAKLRELNPDTELFLPGHEFKTVLPMAKERSKKQQVKVAFMGYIDRRLDFEWLMEILKNPDMRLYLIGPRENIDTDFFPGLFNLEFVEPLTGELLQRKLFEMDVLIMPYDISFRGPITTTAPNKFFQYLAVGKPVVISDMPNFIDMPIGVLYRAKTAVEFVTKIRQAYEEDNNELINMRLKIAQENTWDKRGVMLCNIIQKRLNFLKK
ncbi:glycosyltransferase [Desulfobacula sp.]|uniref:glycosyltransferase n=1 Tax=Desulfobacula sp. TaxID=2593537 RepID=UPI0027152C1F|nr:glycosyltransferase [Desulfobacula sp.]